MSFDPEDSFLHGVVSNCCGAKVMLGDMCQDCGEGCEPESEDGPSDEQQERFRESAHHADEAYRKSMVESGRGRLLPP